MMVMMINDGDEASQEHRNKSQAQQEWGVMMADADALNTADERCSKTVVIGDE